MSAYLAVAILASATSADAIETSTASEIRRAIEAVVDARGEVFASEAYAFCHDPDYVPTVWGKSFCGAVDASSRAACPQVDRICAEQRGWDLSWGRPLGFMAWIILWALLAALLVAVIRSVWKAAPKASPPTALAPEAPIPTWELPEAPAYRILEWAEREAQAERWDRALLWLQVALLRAFEDARLIRYHPSKTHGDYLRRLRKAPEPQEVYRQVAHATDRMRFGDGHVDPEHVAAALGRARELLSTSGGWLSTAAALVLLLPLTSACGSQGPSFFEDGPEGLSALPVLMERAEVPVDAFRKMPDTIGEDVGVVVVLEPGFGFTSSVYDIMDQGVSVVILQNLFGFAGEVPLVGHPPPDGPRHWKPAGRGPCAPPAELRGTAPVLLPQMVTMRALDPSGVDSGVLLESEWKWDIEPLLVTEDHEGSAAIAMYRFDEDAGAWPGCYIALGGSEPLQNASMTRADNLAWVLAVLTSLRFEGGERIWFVDRIGGPDAPTAPPQRIAGSRVMAVVLQTGLALVLLLLAAGAAFGPLRDPVGHESHAFVEHVRAVGRHYERAGELGLLHAARSLARLVVFRYRGQARGEMAWSGLARDLAEKHGLTEAEVRQALAHGLDEGQLGRPGPARRATEVLTTVLGSLRDPEQTQR